MASQCYHEGDFWYAVGATEEGQSPTTNPELWRRIGIPAEWRRVLGKMMEARIQRAEGQHDKAIAAERDAVRAGDDARASGLNERGRPIRMNVRTR